MDPGDALQVSKAGFDYTMLAFFALVLVAVSVQNWVLARRAEHKPLLPSWMRPGASDTRTNDQPPSSPQD